MSHIFCFYLFLIFFISNFLLVKLYQSYCIFGCCNNFFLIFFFSKQIFFFVKFVIQKNVLLSCHIVNQRNTRSFTHFLNSLEEKKRIIEKRHSTFKSIQYLMGNNLANIFITAMLKTYSKIVLNLKNIFQNCRQMLAVLNFSKVCKKLMLHIHKMPQQTAVMHAHYLNRT